MDATRLFKYTVYCPIDTDNTINVDIQLSLEEAWVYFNDTGCNRFMACDALSLEHKCCALDFTNLTPNEQIDIYRALKGR